jgi:hypothetical protein
MPDFGIMRGFNEKLFGDKLVAGQLPTQLGLIGSQQVVDFIGLLDTYPNAAAAYSLRGLRINYTGSLIRVRRSSDNAEQDFGFIDNIERNLDTTALTTFCSGTDGFITTWYDQSGNAYNATQTTAANQPQIVSSGSVILENGKPSVKFDGINDCLFSANVTSDIFSNTSIFSALRIVAQSGEDIPFGYGQTGLTNSIRVMYASSSQKLGFATWSNDYTSTIDSISATLYLYSIIQNGQSISLRKNATTNTSTLLSLPNNTSTGSYCIGTLIGTLSSNYFSQITGSEFIFYGSEKSSIRTGIESNINTYYAIY